MLFGIFEMHPQWYTFFYLTTRLGLRAGEVYAVARSRIRDVPPQLIVDRAVQRGNKSRPAMLGPRKNNKALTLALTEDVADAIRWHIRQGYAGARVPVQQGRDLLGPHQRPRATAPCGPASSRSSRAQSPQSGPPFGGQPGCHERPLHQGHPGSARAPVRAQHPPIRPPWAGCATPTGRRFGALRATSRQRQVNERKGLAAIHRTTFRNDTRSDAARSSTRRGLRIHSPKHAFRLTDRPKTSYILLEADVCGVIRTNQLGS